MNATYDVSAFREFFEHEFTWLNGFLRNVGRFGNNIAIYDDTTDKSWTYRQLNSDANRLSHALLDDGLHQGDVIMYMMFNSPEFAFCYLAGHKTGAIGCPLNYRLGEGEIALIIDDSKPDFFIFHEEFATSALKALDRAEHKPRRLLVVSKGGLKDKKLIDFYEYMQGKPETNPILTFKQHIYDETTRLYTSGTTNRSKGVPINSINEVMSAHDVIMHFPLNNTDRTMNMTPWFHRGGLHSGGLTPTLYAGGESVILKEFNPRHCLQLAERKKVTFMIGVPSVIALLARVQENTPCDLSSLRGIVTMGSPFEKKACEHYMQILTPNIFNGYGTTETFWNTFLRPYNLPDMAGSAGRACTDDDVRVARLSTDGSPSSSHILASKDNKEIGEIIIKTPAKTTCCYFNNPELTQQKFHNGYLLTGDLGTWDENEFITVVGRKDDMILCAGENIYATQIEAILNEHPKVAECAVAGKPDKRHGQVVVAYIVPLDKSLTVEELKSYCVSHPMLPPYKRPKSYYFLDSLPRTATGKLMHYKLREQLLQNELKN